MAENEVEAAVEPRKRRLAMYAIAAVLVLAGVGFLIWGGGGSPEPTPAAQVRQQESNSVTVPKVDLKKLKTSDTYATIKGAPRDRQRNKSTKGAVVHPTMTVPVFTAPGGKAIAKLKSKQFGDTWLPVIDARPGWVQVLLPSKPNGSTGWLSTYGLRVAKSGYQIRLDLSDKQLELWHRGRAAGSWTVGIGKADTPTPVGRTFVLGSITDRKQDYSPVILPLGSHSDTLDTFGGGPGTVAIHTWPSDDVYGTASSHGCVRVPQDALDKLTKVPLGTLVLVRD